MSRFTNTLVVSPLADGKTWVLVRPFGYDMGQEEDANTVNVEAGFATDFASIPRVFWIVLPRWGKYGYAAVVHDWLYWRQDRSRATADRIMLEAMGVSSVPAWRKHPIYWAVRAFGWMAWKRNQWDRDAGFNRVLRLTQIKLIHKLGRPGLLRRTWRCCLGRG